MAKMSRELFNKYLDTSLVRRLVQLMEEAEDMRDMLRNVESEDAQDSVDFVRDIVSALVDYDSPRVKVSKDRIDNLALSYYLDNNSYRSLKELKHSALTFRPALWHFYHIYDQELHEVDENSGDLRESRRLKMCLDILDRIDSRLKPLISIQI